MGTKYRVSLGTGRVNDAFSLASIFLKIPPNIGWIAGPVILGGAGFTAALTQGHK